MKNANEKYNTSIPCYIMTSRENDEETKDFFENNNFFEYPRNCIMFFKQNELPLLSEDGKLLLGKDKLIKLAANGNGGIFESMAKNGIIDDMEKRGIKWVFVGSVDNILIPLVDPMLIGLAKSNKTEIATKTISKINPYEKVGVFCKKNGKIGVIEYTEMPQDIIKLTDDNGNLVFSESHIMCNLFSTSAIKLATAGKMEYHVAHKKSEYLDENGNIVVPEEPNCYKFEKFIFDAFEMFDRISILSGKREEIFAPIKNKDGADSPESAKVLYENYMKGEYKNE